MSSSSAPIVIGLGLVLCVAVAGAGGYFMMNSGSSSSSSGAAAAAAAMQQQQQLLAPPPGPAGPAPISAGDPVLRPGPYQGKQFYWLRGNDSSTNAMISQSPSKVQVATSSQCPQGLVTIKSLDTQRYLQPDANQQVQWVSTFETPYGCWARVKDPACAGTSETFESARFKGYRLKRGVPGNAGGPVRVSLAAPGEYNTDTNTDFQGMCWLEDTYPSATTASA